MVAVSVIMPVYEAEEFLENTIENFTKQTLHDVELICVNDGSTDKSAEILDKLSKKYDFIHVINQENQGSGYAETMELQMHVVNILHFLMQMTYS
ncbi:MAG: glycosyltransferase [Methanosphaera sp.]|nr:glycosyltransferase [Methanosphaera sp.]MDD6534948.1 glycosyltransferase [Methanosphaera sp.]